MNPSCSPNVICYPSAERSANFLNSFKKRKSFPRMGAISDLQLEPIPATPDDIRIRRAVHTSPYLVEILQ